MKIKIHLDSMKQTRWYEYLIRFTFGGLVTVATGIITNKYGPVVGGMFLAFPSIFPASVTLIQTHQEKREKEEGKDKELRTHIGRQAAGVTSFGSALGSFGLFAYAIIIWQLSIHVAAWLVLFLALVIWLAAGVLAWWIHHVIGGKVYKHL